MKLEQVVQYSIVSYCTSGVISERRLVFFPFLSVFSVKLSFIWSDERRSPGFLMNILPLSSFLTAYRAEMHKTSDIWPSLTCLVEIWCTWIIFPSLRIG